MAHQERIKVRKTCSVSPYATHTHNHKHTQFPVIPMSVIVLLCSVAMPACGCETAMLLQQYFGPYKPKIHLRIIEKSI